MSRTGFFTNEVTQWHGIGFVHPETRNRVKAIQSMMIETKLIEQTVLYEGYAASNEQLETVHTKEHIKRMINASEYKDAKLKFLKMSGDVYFDKYTLNSARYSAGLALQAAEKVLAGEIDNAIVITRPPGHHATANSASGFCFFNNVALAARLLLKNNKKVAIFDWDVHFGDGTTAILKDDKNCLLISVHRHDNGDFYPSTGSSQTLGSAISIGFNGSITGAEYRNIFNTKVFPTINKFSPDVIIISAGFDAADGDPLGGCKLKPEDYQYMTEQLRTLSNKLIVCLEGGYNLEILAKCIESVVREVLRA